MPQTEETVQDFLTGRKLPFSDDEYIRQATERLLVQDKGYSAEMIEVNHSFVVHLKEQRGEGRVDLLVRHQGRPFMAIKCIRGSLVTREREALAASRLACDIQIPLTVITNGEDAEVLDTLTGQVLGKRLEAIPDLAQARVKARGLKYVPLPEKKREREGRIFCAYLTFQCPAKCPA